MQKKSEKIIFTLYLLGFLALALTIALLQPLANTPPLFGNPPDEHARYLIPQFICKYGRIPTGLEEEVRIPAYGFSYALYNVFPYIVQGYIMRFVSLFTESEIALLYTARLVNVTFGLLMAMVVYFIGRRTFRDARFRWLFCFAVTYLPEGLFMHTYVNTDSCCMLSTAMMIYALVCVYQDGINLRNSLWMSGGIILCALSYYNAYGYIVIGMQSGDVGLTAADFNYALNEIAKENPDVDSSSIVSTKESINGIAGYKRIVYYPADDMYLITFTFDGEDGILHYISVEYPASETEYSDLFETVVYNYHY